MRGHRLYSAATQIVFHLVCRASELKEELNRLGLPSTGSRQQLEERLMHHYETAQDAQYEALAAQVNHSYLLCASATFMQSMCVLLLCCVPAAMHCCASCNRISLLHGFQSWGEAYLRPSWLTAQPSKAGAGML